MFWTKVAKAESHLMPGWKTQYGQYINPIDREIYPEGRPDKNNRRGAGFKIIAKKRLRLFAKQNIGPYISEASVDFLIREADRIINKFDIRSGADSELNALSDKIIDRWISVRPEMVNKKIAMVRELYNIFMKI